MWERDKVNKFFVDCAYYIQKKYQLMNELMG